MAAAPILLGVQASAAVYHVAQRRPAADDANSGSAGKPWRTISKAAAVMRPGDRVIVHAGTYREWVSPRNSGTAEAPITYEAAAGEEVVLTGADITTGWTRDRAAVWKLDQWTTRFMVSRGKDYHPSDERHRLIGRAEQVIVDGKLLRQVLSRQQMKPGTFCAEAAKRKLYVWPADGSDPNAHTMEVGKRGWAFGINPWGRPRGVDHIRVRGFTIRHASNHAQQGALYIVGRGWVVEDVTVEWTNGCGWSFAGENHVLRGIVSRHNGQMGGRGSDARKFLMERCVFAANNRKGYDTGWEAGGIKILRSRDAQIRECLFRGNKGPGLWLDVDNRNILITESYAADNTDSGIFVEISGWCKLTNNLCVRNGTGSGREVEGWASAGILIAESRNCLVKNNTCAYNRDGIAMREQGPRTLPGIDGKPSTWFCTQNVFTHNIMAHNRGFQFAHWADNNYYGKHPGHKGELTAQDLRRNPPYDPAKMKFVIDRNLYFPPKGRPLQLWGCPWRKRSRIFQTLRQTRGYLGLDSRSFVVDPMFVDATSFRLAPASPARSARVGPLAETPHRLAADTR